jgi:NADH-quinone oxidoreductase subunit M
LLLNNFHFLNIVTLLEAIIAIPIGAALAIALGSPARPTAMAAAVVNLVLVFMAFGQYDLTIEGVYQLAGSHPIITVPDLANPGAEATLLGLSTGVDGISLVLLLLTGLVTLAAVWVSPAEDQIKGSKRLYYLSSLLISAGALGAFCSTDLFFFFAFHELALIPTFLMIGIFGSGPNRVRVAWKTTIYLGVGSMILLAGLVALFVSLGGLSLQFADLQAWADAPAAFASASLENWIFLTLLVGFGILVSLFPFHTWAPEAYATAPTPTAMLHAGVLKKFGLYGLIRIALPMLPNGAAHWQTLLLVLLVGNILYVGYVTMAQQRFDLMLGNSSVMHMGYAFLGIAAMNVIGVQGAVMLMFAHGISIALLFALNGHLRKRFGTLEFDRIGGGLGKLLPALGLVFGFAVMAMIGLPGFANFAAEVMIFFGGFSGVYSQSKGIDIGPVQVATICAIWGVVISAVYGLRAYRRLFMGPLPAAGKGTGPADLTLSDRIPLVLLVLALLVIGFAPGLLLKYLIPTIENISQFGSITG